MAGRKSNVTPELALKALEEMKKLKEGNVHTRLLAIVKSLELQVGDVAKFLGYDRSIVSLWIKKFREQGVEGLKDRPKGHYPSKLGAVHKKQIAEWLDSQQDSDGKPVHWTIEKLRLEIKRVFDISISYTPLRLHLHKMGFVQKVPRPHHIKADKKAQEKFKKKMVDLEKTILPSSNKMLFFFDEGRFGLNPILARFWARRGERIVADVNPRYMNFYAYSSVSSHTGESFSLLLPWVNTDMMNLYLDRLSKAYPHKEIHLVMDQAGWHKSKALKIPENIEIIYLPPYSPELNPVERLWQWLKRHVCRNRYFESEESLIEEICLYMKKISKFEVMKLCSCSYLSYYK